MKPATTNATRKTSVSMIRLCLPAVGSGSVGVCTISPYTGAVTLAIGSMHDPRRSTGSRRRLWCHEGCGSLYSARPAKLVISRTSLRSSGLIVLSPVMCCDQPFAPSSLSQLSAAGILSLKAALPAVHVDSIAVFVGCKCYKKAAGKQVVGGFNGGRTRFQ
jgi:hypothetical protein